MRCERKENIIVLNVILSEIHKDIHCWGFTSLSNILKLFCVLYCQCIENWLTIDPISLGNIKIFIFKINIFQNTMYFKICNTPSPFKGHLKIIFIIIYSSWKVKRCSFLAKIWYEKMTCVLKIRQSVLCRYESFAIFFLFKACQLY